MKITDFLKKFTLINSKFIDDFYSFYDEGKNEYVIDKIKIYDFNFIYNPIT